MSKLYKRFAKSIVVLTLVFGAITTSSYLLQSTVQAQPAPAPAAQPNAQETTNDGTTCAIEKIGWILCPVIESTGRIADTIFNQLASNFLEIETELVSGDKNGTKYAWGLSLNIANIMFIITFLVIIYSQITGAGVSNYGIKRMLPRLIFAAVLVNISYWICQLMVDVSNILGYVLKEALTGAAANVSDVAAMPASGGLIDNTTSNGVLGTIAIAGLAVVGLVWFLLPILALGVGTVAITCLILVVILLMRKAFIIILVVLSPIAFVAYLLPNTEKWFKKWLDMFWKLLMVFPVVGLLFGAGQLASAIVLSAGSNPDQSTSSLTAVKEDGSSQCITLPSSGSGGTTEATVGPCQRGSTSLMLGIIAAIIAVAPLLAIKAVLESAIAATGAVGVAVTSGLGRVTKGTTERTNKARDSRKERRAAQALSGGAFNRANLATFGRHRRSAKRDAIQAGRSSNLKNASQQYIANEMSKDNKPTYLAKRVAGGGIAGEGATTEGLSRAMAGAQFTITKAEADAVEAEKVLLRGESETQLQKFAQDPEPGDQSVSKQKRIAAMQMTIDNADFEGMNKVIDQISSNGSKEMRNALADALKHSKSRPGYVGQGAIAAMRQGSETQPTDNSSAMIKSAIDGNAYSADAMANSSKDELKTVGKFALDSSNGVSTASLNTFKANALEATSNPLLANKLGKNRNNIDAIGAGDEGRLA